MSLANTKAVRPFPIVIVGHVDHGKSTLVGRLLSDTDSLPDGKLDEIKAASAKRGVAFEWSFVLDALQVERDQGITLDTTRIWFKTETRPYMIIDAPGHTAFLKNMVTGAANAEAAILIVDVVEGVSEQTRRHAYLLNLLGVRQVGVVVNKMDAAGYDQGRFEAVRGDITGYLKGLDIEPVAVVPVSAREGDGIVSGSDNLRWYAGPNVIDVLDGFERKSLPTEKPLRLPVQDVLRRGDERIILGRIEAGRLKVGDSVRVMPGGEEARVAGFQTWASNGTDKTTAVAASAGQSVAFTIDKDLFIERGHMLGGADSAGRETLSFKARLFWLDENPLTAGERVTIRIGTAEHRVVVDSIDTVVDVETLESTADGVDIERNGVAEVTFRSRSRIALDLYADSAAQGRGVVVRGHRISGGFIVLSDGGAENITPVDHNVSVEERAVVNGHQGGVLWLTGLSGSGKSTVAMAFERRMFERGWQVFTLDGDNLRTGLCRDLDFTDEGRSENIRRAAETSKILAEAGVLVVATFISPLAEQRALAKSIIGEAFREVHLDADLTICEGRDPKGLYAKARAGEIPNFTGVSSPYEAPKAADWTVKTSSESVQESVKGLADFAERVFQSGAIRAKAG